MAISQTPLVRQAEALFQRHTSPRRKLLDLLLTRESHFSAEEIARAMPEVGRATVYRTIAHLVESGILCRVLLDGGGLHYQPAPQRHHHHLMCIRCNRVADVESCEVSGFADRIARSNGFSPLTHRLEVYGLCPTCCQGESIPQ